MTHYNVPEPAAEERAHRRAVVVVVLARVAAAE
jgi:hypothetical protein